MGSRVVFSWEDNDILEIQGMAGPLSAKLSTEGKVQREAWDKLHGMLGQIAGYLSIADGKMPIEALVLKLKENMGARTHGHPDVEALLQKIMAIFKKRIRAENADSSKAIQLLKDLIMLVAKELNLLPLCDSIHREMIQEYTFYEEKVKHLVKWSDELSAPGAPYTVISIVGAQSSGKSYLLNQLFGTDFPVMNAKEGRRQTTRGILISRCIRPTLLLLDVEGFDGRERGQDTTFEKQAALFALTTSDLMMVNISMHDIGREQGGGAPLFKTIFQERTKLPKGLTKLIIVVRYYDEETPLVLLEEDIMKSMEEMWKSAHVNLKEPVIFKDYIEVKVVVLPEKNSPGFRKQVTELRNLLSESTVDHNRSARVPASSFPVSSRMLWEEIKQNKRLDLPTHKDMIATLYCQQKVDDAIEHFVSHKDYELLRHQESPQSFKEASDKLLESIITRYDQETDVYDAAIRGKERQKLKRKINECLGNYTRELIQKMRGKMAEQYKNEFLMNIKTMGESHLLDYQTQITRSCKDKFRSLCEDLKSFDVEYLHDIEFDLIQEVQSYCTYHIIGLKEERFRKEIEVKAQKSDKELQEVSNKLKALKLEEGRMKEQLRLETEKRENELKRVREEADREHQKFTVELEGKKRDYEEELEDLQRMNRELEANQKGQGCTIL